jgi:hypothetical protein
VRITDWRIPFCVLLLCALAELSWGASSTANSVLLPVPDPATYRDLQNLQQAIVNPVISTGTAKVLTITSKLTVPNGVASTDAAAFGQIPTFVDWTSYSPTINAGFGTVTNVSFFYSRVNNTVFVKGAFKCGNTANTTSGISIPIGTINYLHMPNPVGGTTPAGFWGAARANPTNGILFSDGSDNSTVWFVAASGGSVGSGYVKGTGGNLFDNNDYVTVEFSYAL